MHYLSNNKKNNVITAVTTTIILIVGTIITTTPATTQLAQAWIDPDTDPARQKAPAVISGENVYIMCGGLIKEQQMQMVK
jgi:cell division protein FtsW (lipid II flippase)